MLQPQLDSVVDKAQVGSKKKVESLNQVAVVAVQFRSSGYPAGPMHLCSQSMHNKVLRLSAVCKYGRL